MGSHPPVLGEFTKGIRAGSHLSKVAFHCSIRAHEAQAPSNLCLWEKGGSGAQVWLRHTMNIVPTPASTAPLPAADLWKTTLHNGKSSITFVGSLLPFISAGCTC